MRGCKDVYERRERGRGGERRMKRVFLKEKEKENKGGIDKACSL